MTRPVWAEISSGRLTANFAVLTRQAKRRAALLCVIKANAYGHGMVECGRTLTAAGARWLGVTSMEEGVAMRIALADSQVNIVILGGIALTAAGEAEARAVVEHRLVPVLWEVEQVRWLARAAREQGLAAGSMPVHIELETGMARMGVAWDDLAALEAVLGQLQRDSPLRVAGVMTHYASPERPADAMNQRQTERFAEALKTFHRKGVAVETVSAGNSDTLFHPQQVEQLHALAVEYGANLVIRPGLELYGAGFHAVDRGLSPVLAWKNRVVTVHNLPVGTTVGYGSIFTTTRPSRIALVAAGYADGLARSLSNRGAMLVRGKRAPIAGRISMDFATLDVTDIAGVEPGDEVVIIGSQGAEQISAAEIAAMLGTIPYEVVCGIAARVPRIVV